MSILSRGVVLKKIRLIGERFVVEYDYAFSTTRILFARLRHRPQLSHLVLYLKKKQLKNEVKIDILFYC